MQPAHAVDFLAGLAEEGRHAELLALVLGVRAAEAHEVVPRDAEFFGHRAKIFVEETFIEIVVTGRHGRVYGVERRGTHEFEGFVERKAALHEVYETLHVAKGGVALVAVVNVFLNAELLQGEHTADTEEVLLLDTVFPVAAVEGVRNSAIVFRVQFIVGVEQVEGHAAYVGTPKGSVNHEVGIRHVDNHLVAVLVEHALNGQAVEVLSLVVGNLLAVHRERLREITIAVEETYGYHVHIAIGGFLQIVAGKNAKAARINFKHVVQTIFHAEISHRGTLGIRLFSHVSMKVCVHLVHAGEEFLVLRKFFETVVVDAAEQFDGVFVHLLPKFLVKRAEQGAGVCTPRPPQVVRHLVQFFQSFGQVAFYSHDFPRGLVRVTYFYVHYFD